MRNQPELTVIFSGLFGAVIECLVGVLSVCGAVCIGEWLREQPRWDTVGDFASILAKGFGFVGAIAGLLCGGVRGIFEIYRQREQCPDKGAQTNNGT
jgi:hypothetical protein